MDRHGSRLSAVAFGVVRASGPLHTRLRDIYDALRVIVADHRPAELALEDVFFGKDLRAMEKIGEGRAIAKLVAAQGGMTVTEYPPATVKLAVAGNGGASKESVGRMVQAAFALRELPQPADASDALALALCHCTRGPVERVRSRHAANRGWTEADVARVSRERTC